MSQITEKDIKKVAKLARIEVSEESCSSFAGQVTRIIDWVEKLNEVNTDNVKPLVSVYDIPLAMEKDEVVDGNIAKEVLQNAKNSKYDYFTVPKVIE